MEACIAAVLVGVIYMRKWAALPMVLGAWSVTCAYWRSFVLIVGVPCLFCSLAVPGVWSFLRVTQVPRLSLRKQVQSCRAAGPSHVHLELVLSHPCT